MVRNVRVFLDRVRTGAQTQWMIRMRRKDFQQCFAEKQKQLVARLGLNGEMKAWPITLRKLQDIELSIPIRLFHYNDEWVLGPILGILTSVRGQTFGGNRTDHRDLSRMGKHTHTCVFVLTPESIVYEQNQIHGYVWTGYKNKPWVLVDLPIPDVVYNRIPNRARERDAMAIEAKQWLIKKTKGHLYNSRFFNKVELMKYMSDSEETRIYLPRTEIFQSRNQLIQWLRNRPIIYVKPANGTIGQGIIRIDRSYSGWTIKKQLQGEQIVRHYQQLQPAVSTISQWIARGNYIIQEGVQLANWQGRIFDFRVLLQKDRRHRWKVTGLGARVAGLDGITTHVPNGGKIANAKQVLEDVFPGNSARIYNEIKHLALVSAQQIEKNISNVGEMSMDIGVDDNGKPWFIEANAKPMKFDEPTIRLRSLLRIIHYAEGLYV
ncbi:YheC/YheD family protein [Fodinisporobacter ferrooxydans]|uniref:YheC/YheD family protein n=1 Tax=Fodinisporobacter ferrooxydans TaxID=2901836 RepID=A0ABY4CFX9_9BACL|nr:YheC/YheD family protein [Alicyclobacillaceae bacterium MYW30-H2]